MNSEVANEKKNTRHEYTIWKVTKVKKDDEKKPFDRKSGFSVDDIVSSYILKQLFSVWYDRGNDTHHYHHPK